MSHTNAQSPTASGWPFLVARGRRRGYSTLLAPSFLIAEGDYGVLEEAVTPTAEPGHAEVIRVATRADRALSVAYATHVVTAADLAPAPTRPVQTGPAQSGPVQTGPVQTGPPGTPQPPPRDEHSRPLTLLYGFVCRDAWITEPAPADLRFAHETALRVYRDFLDDEEGFAVIAADSYGLHSPVVTGRTPVGDSGHPPAYPSSAAYSSSPEYPSSAAYPTAEPPGRRPAFPWYLAIFVLAVAIVAVFAVMVLGRSDTPDIECLNGANAAAHAIVDCDDPTAEFKILGEIPDKTRAESGNVEICRSHHGTTTTFWQAGEGTGKEKATGTILCLAPAD